MWEAQVRSLGREDPLEKEMAMHSSILAWRVAWTEEPGGLQSMGSQRVGHDRATELKVILESKKPCKNVSFEETSPHRNVKSVSSSPPGASMRSFSLRFFH